MPSLHPFDTAVQLKRQSDRDWIGKTIPDYHNMVGAFGGIVSASLMNAILSDERTIGHPVSMTINYCAALGDGEFEISSDVMRKGKYTQHWNLSLTQNSKLTATASIVMGVRSPDVFSHHSTNAPEVPKFEDCEPFAPIGPLKWLDRYDFRFIEGAPDLVPTESNTLSPAKSALWIQDNPSRPLDYLSLAALSDTFFLRLLQVRGRMVPMGTVSLTTHFLATPDELAEQGSDAILGLADSTRFHANFHDQQVQLWSKTGKILATGTQVAWYKE